MNAKASSLSPWPKKRKRPQMQKPMIRWEVLGLSAPPQKKEPPSIDLIRQAVSVMASRGVGQGSRAPVKHVELEGGDLNGVRAVKRRRVTD